jgi:DNA polymerase/3'-5' exonuclease PolX
MNKIIVDNFSKLIQMLKIEHNLLIDKTERIKNSYKISSLAKNMNIIHKMKRKIQSSEELKNIYGFGKGTLSRVDEILNTGTLSELDSLKEKHKKLELQNLAVEELTSVIAIGPVKAIELVNEHNIQSVADLKNRVKKGTIQVNDKIILGLKYHGKYCTKINRNIIRKIEDKIGSYMKELSSDIKWMICGSYRREKSHSSDIDLLIQHKDVITGDDVSNSHVLSEIIMMLKSHNFISDDITSSDVKTKYMGFCTYKNTIYRLDIRLVPKQSWYTAIAYFTGSYQHNIIMRNKAIKMGMKLNEYGLFMANGSRIPINTEKDIYKVLKMPWLEPTQR